MILAGARHLAQTFKQKLDQVNATTITLDRDEALLALGLIEGVAEQLQAELQRRGPS